MPRLKKGSREAKLFMAKIRAKRKGFTLKRKALPKSKKFKTQRIKTRTISRTMPKKRKARRRRGFLGGGGLQKPLVAGITYAFVQPFLSQFLSRFNIGIQDELVQILAAIVLKNTLRNPIVNNWANAAIIINTAALAAGFAGRILPTGNQTNNLNTPMVNVIG